MEINELEQENAYLRHDIDRHIATLTAITNQVIQLQDRYMTCTEVNRRLNKTIVELRAELVDAIDDTHKLRADNEWLRGALKLFANKRKV